MPHFPMFVDLKNRRVVVVGGGSVAQRKLQKLAPFGARRVVIAPEILPAIQDMDGVARVCRRFRRTDLDPRPALVIAATDDRQENRRIALLCRRRHIPVNVADDPKACSFLFPALITEGRFAAGLSTGGASPAAAALLKERMREQLPDHLDDILTWMEEQRPAIKQAVPDQSRRAAIFREMLKACLTQGGPLPQEEADKLLRGERAGSVALVGAGCGKADLITLRGLRLLRQCQAVVYDDLIDPALLDAAPESALRIPMGKRSGAPSASQEEINRKMIELARSGLRVVRLKGGDPYLFGRGGEEMLALQAAGILCQEVPGIPSAMGIPAEAGIPVTHRGLSRGLHIVTGHTANTVDGLPEDFDALAGLSGTLVFLMGLSQLPRIVERLMAAGRRGDTPAAVLSGGNAPKPATVRAPLAQLELAVKAAGVEAPAIIVVGDVAALDLTAYSAPLGGVRVGITGTEGVAMKQQAALRALGADTVWLSRAAVKERPLTLNIADIRREPCWLVFTSANGVKVFFRQIELDAVLGCKLAVIGAATGEALKTFGLCADLCPETFTSDALARALTAAAQPQERIILLRSAQGSPQLPRLLTSAGFAVCDVALYDVEADGSAQEPLPAMDYLTFSSAGGVRLFMEQYGAIPENVRCVCIGDVTARALPSSMAEDCLIAAEASVSGIVDAIVKDRS